MKKQAIKDMQDAISAVQCELFRVPPRTLGVQL